MFCHRSFGCFVCVCVVVLVVCDQTQPGQEERMLKTHTQTHKKSNVSTTQRYYWNIVWEQEISSYESVPFYRFVLSLVWFFVRRFICIGYVLWRMCIWHYRLISVNAQSLLSTNEPNVFERMRRNCLVANLFFSQDFDSKKCIPRTQHIAYANPHSGWCERWWCRKVVNMERT